MDCAVCNFIKIFVESGHVGKVCECYGFKNKRVAGFRSCLFHTPSTFIIVSQDLFYTVFSWVLCYMHTYTHALSALIYKQTTVQYACTHAICICMVVHIKPQGWIKCSNQMHCCSCVHTFRADDEWIWTSEPKRHSTGIQANILRLCVCTIWDKHLHRNFVYACLCVCFDAVI